MSELRMYLVTTLVGWAIWIAPRNADGLRFVRYATAWLKDDTRHLLETFKYTTDPEAEEAGS